jgi:hypothetical protein
MLTLAASGSLGAHPYRTTPDHTRAARQTIGPTALLTPEHKVVPTDTAYARALGRKAIARYLELSNYVN